MIGETWLTTTTGPWVAGPFALGGEQLVAGRADPRPGFGQRLTTRWPEVRIRPPPGPHLGRHRPEGASVELAVVDLDPSIVDLDGEAGGQGPRRWPGPVDSGLEITRVAPATQGPRARAWV